MTTSPDREEIKTLLSEGWKPRVKRVKRYEYISLRRGSGEKEVSLGRKTDELWQECFNHIEGLNEITRASGIPLLFVLLLLLLFYQ